MELNKIALEFIAAFKGKKCAKIARRFLKISCLQDRFFKLKYSFYQRGHKYISAKFF